MLKDKRRSRRRQIRYTAWVIGKPGELHGCVLSDISETGARLDIDNAEAVPGRFVLWLSANGSARRTCLAVWRKPKQIGVKFELRLADTDRAALVPTLNAEHEAEPAQANTNDAAAPAEAATVE